MKNDKFNTIILPLQDKLFRFAASILKDTTNAEDALQEILVKLWERKKEIINYSNVEAFAMKMIKNHCIDRLRRTKNHIDLNDITLSGMNESNPEKQVHLKETTTIAYQLIEQLPPAQQMIMRLRDVEGYEMEEIAEIMEMNTGAVRTNLSRARQTIRIQLVNIELYRKQAK